MHLQYKLYLIQEKNIMIQAVLLKRRKMNKTFTFVFIQLLILNWLNLGNGMVSNFKLSSRKKV